jgi:hypothetical protein
MNVEEPSKWERAKGKEKTLLEKRVSSGEESIKSERATRPEKPRYFERAIIAEKPIIRERARPYEKSKDPERVLTDPVRQSLSVLVRAFYDYQRERMGLDGRLGQKKDGEIKKGIPERDEALLMMLMERRQSCMAMEEGLAKDIAKSVKTHPLWKAFLKDVKGCGESMAAVILTEFNINKAPTVSNLWSFAGLAPGKDRKVKGQKCPYNQFLRAKLCGVLGSSFLKCNSPYRKYYDDKKHRLESADWGMASKNPTDKKRPKAGHQHKAATRYMVKMFLIDLYVAWRTLEGLEVREPYQEQYLGHKHSA